MGDFEDTFGAGADASEIIDGNAFSDALSEMKRRHYRQYLERRADPEWQASEARRIAEEAQREAEVQATRRPHSSPILSDTQQDARRRAIETAIRAQADRLGLPNQGQIDRAVSLAKASEERMEALIRASKKS